MAARAVIIVAVALVVQLLVYGVIRLVYDSQPTTAPLRAATAQQLPTTDPSDADPTAWQSVRLPEKLCRGDCQSRFKLYRFALDQPLHGGELGLYVPSADGAMAVWANGRFIGQSGSLEHPTADMTYQPQFFRFSHSLLNDSEPYIDVLVASLVASGGRLMAPYIGSAVELEAAHRIASGVTVDGLWAITATLVVFVLVASLFYWVSDRDRLFVWFILIAVFAICRNLNVLLPEWPGDVRIRSALYLCSTLGVLLASGAFLSRLVAAPESRLDALLAALGVTAFPLITGMLFIDVALTWQVTVTVTRVVTIVLGSVLLVRLLINSRRYPRFAQATMIALLLGAFSLLLHDVLQSMPPRLLVFQFSNLAALPLVLSFAVAVAMRYRELARMADDPAVSVAQRASVLATERRRLLRDMHDGVAGRLATLLQRVRHDPGVDQSVADELELSLADLRLVIDSLDSPDNRELGQLMGQLRARLDHWLGRHNIALTWDVHPVAPQPMTAEQALHVLRIVQESLTNVVTHANATAVTVSLSENADGVRLVVADNGVPTTEPTISGRGRGILAERVTALGGDLLTGRTVDGYAVTVHLPRPPRESGGRNAPRSPRS
ncbi:MAG: hypothetical protein AAGH76_17920 [Pseudomonadota bacterium]